MKRHQYLSTEKILTGDRCAGQRVKDGGKPEEIEKGTKAKPYFTVFTFHILRCVRGRRPERQSQD